MSEYITIKSHPGERAVESFYGLLEVCDDYAMILDDPDDFTFFFKDLGQVFKAVPVDHLLNDAEVGEGGVLFDGDAPPVWPLLRSVRRHGRLWIAQPCMIGTELIVKDDSGYHSIALIDVAYWDFESDEVLDLMHTEVNGETAPGVTVHDKDYTDIRLGLSRVRAGMERVLIDQSQSIESEFARPRGAASIEVSQLIGLSRKMKRFEERVCSLLDLDQFLDSLGASRG